MTTNFSQTAAYIWSLATHKMAAQGEKIDVDNTCLVISAARRTIRLIPVQTGLR